jgi:hypothetical protein
MAKKVLKAGALVRYPGLGLVKVLMVRRGPKGRLLLRDARGVEWYAGVRELRKRPRGPGRDAAERYLDIVRGRARFCRD